MKYFAVTTEHTPPAYDASLPMREQKQWKEHAAFMNNLADEGFVILGGLLGDGSMALLIIDADSEKTIEMRLAADPWAVLKLLRIIKIEPWEILLEKTSKA